MKKLSLLKLAKRELSAIKKELWVLLASLGTEHRQL